MRGQVAWSALTPLYGGLYGLTVVLAYAIFRQGMGRTLAAVGATMLMLSTLHLNNLPHLRDYAKAQPAAMPVAGDAMGGVIGGPAIRGLHSAGRNAPRFREGRRANLVKSHGRFHERLWRWAVRSRKLLDGVN